MEILILMVMIHVCWQETAIQKKTAGQKFWRGKQTGRSRITESAEDVFRIQEVRFDLPVNS